MQKRKSSRNRFAALISKIFLLFLLGGSIAVSGCKDNAVCDPTSQPNLQVHFATHYKYRRNADGTFIDSVPANVVVYKITGLKALRPDSAILQDTIRDTTGIGGFAAPVSNLDSVSRYVIVVNKNRGGIGNSFVSDTLSISYDKRLKFISQGCGYAYVYTILNTSCTQNFFKGSRLFSPLISNGGENIRLYFTQ